MNVPEGRDRIMGDWDMEEAKRRGSSRALGWTKTDGFKKRKLTTGDMDLVSSALHSVYIPYIAFDHTHRAY